MSKINVLAPTAGVHIYPCPADKKDTFENRWNRHFYTLYGVNHNQVKQLNGNLSKVPSSLITRLIHTPYWDITSHDALRVTGQINQGDPVATFGLLDYINIAQPISVLLIALVTKMNIAADLRLTSTVNLDTLLCKNPDKNLFTGALLKAAALVIDILLRLPFGIVATRSTHIFDIVKRLTAMVIATVTAGLSQMGAELSYLATDMMTNAPSPTFANI